MLPLHRRHQQLLQEAFGRETTSSSFDEYNIQTLVGGSGIMENDYHSDLNATVANLENISLTEKIPPSLRILRCDN